LPLFGGKKADYACGVYVGGGNDGEGLIDNANTRGEKKLVRVRVRFIYTYTFEYTIYLCIIYTMYIIYIIRVYMKYGGREEGKRKKEKRRENSKREKERK
jgi:hypothetical protein